MKGRIGQTALRENLLIGGTYVKIGGDADDEYHSASRYILCNSTFV